MKEGGWYGWMHLRKLEFARFIECVTGYHRTLTTYLNTLLLDEKLISLIMQNIDIVLDYSFWSREMRNEYISLP